MIEIYWTHPNIDRLYSENQNLKIKIKIKIMIGVQWIIKIQIYPLFYLAYTMRTKMTYNQALNQFSR